MYHLFIYNGKTERVIGVEGSSVELAITNNIGAMHELYKDCTLGKSDILLVRKMSTMEVAACGMLNTSVNLLAVFAFRFAYLQYAI